METHYDVVVLGGGPAGLTAGIYLGRARAKTLIVDSGTIGGQTVLSYSVANYPGVEETAGRTISQTMLKQARGFGCEVRAYTPIEAMDLEANPKRLRLKRVGEVTARAVIIATGGIPRTLGLEAETRFVGKGISYCATCDGDFFTGKPIAVIGGGNSALEEALALTEYASKVTIIHEFDHFQAEPWIIEEVRANPKIALLMEQDVRDFVGDEKLEAVVSAHKKTGEVVKVPVDGCFIFIGYVPNSAMFRDVVALSERGEIVTDDRLATSVPGVFAAGDVRAKRYRQITTAVADGTVAALGVLETLREGTP